MGLDAARVWRREHPGARSAALAPHVCGVQRRAASGDAARVRSEQLHRGHGVARLSQSAHRDLDRLGSRQGGQGIFGTGGRGERGQWRSRRRPRTTGSGWLHPRDVVGRPVQVHVDDRLRSPHGVRELDARDQGRAVRIGPRDQLKTCPVVAAQRPAQVLITLIRWCATGGGTVMKTRPASGPETDSRPARRTRRPSLGRNARSRFEPSRIGPRDQLMSCPRARSAVMKTQGSAAHLPET